MQIHDLNTKALTDPAYVAFDDGTDTYKADFKAEIDNAAADAVADADLTDNTVAFTSGDAASPTSWTAVSVLTNGLTIKVLFNRISTMIKNVRWLYSKLGTTDISSIGGGTVTGAISSLNSKIGAVVTGTTLTTTATAKTTVHVASMTLPAGTWVVCASVQFTSNFSESALLNIVNSGYVTGIVRGTGVNGGGLTTSMIIVLTASTTIYMDVNQQNASDSGMNQIQFRAVRIK